MKELLIINNFPVPDNIKFIIFRELEHSSTEELLKIMCKLFETLKVEANLPFLHVYDTIFSYSRVLDEPCKVDYMIRLKTNDEKEF